MISREKLGLLLPELRERDIQDIFPYEVSDVIQGIDKPIYVVTCHCFKSRASYLNTSSEICLIHNTYITSIFYHLGLFQLAFDHYNDSKWLHDLEREILIKSLAKSFIAEQCFAIQDTSMARTLLLETAMDVESKNRKLFSLRDEQENLEASSQLLAKIASDFSLHHEVGHHASFDQRFVDMVEPVIEEYIQDIDDSVDANHLRYECFADIFALNCCIGRYSSTLSEERLVQYLAFVVSLFSVTNSLYLYAEDMHRNNYGEPPFEAERERFASKLLSLSYREANMAGYLSTFTFSEDTVTCLHEDDFLPLYDGHSISRLLTDFDFFVDAQSEDTRRLAELISQAFEPNRGFQYYVDNSKVYRPIS